MCPGAQAAESIGRQRAGHADVNYFRVPRGPPILYDAILVSFRYCDLCLILFVVCEEKPRGNDGVDLIYRVEVIVA